MKQFRNLVVIGCFFMLGLVGLNVMATENNEKEKISESTRKPLFGVDLSDGVYRAGVWKYNDQGELSAASDSNIWSKVKYGDCVITLEYKLSSRANAGVLIKCSDTRNWIPNTVEIQLLDDYGTEPDYHSNASFYGYQAPSKVLTRPAGEWNQMEITCRGSVITVKLNGEVVNEMDMSQWTDPKKSPSGSEIEGKFQGKALADASRFGYVGLQGLHGKSPVVYRNLFIAPILEVDNK